MPHWFKDGDPHPNREDEIKRTEKLAKNLRTRIPEDIVPNLCFLPILEKLLERIEKLENGEKDV